MDIKTELLSRGQWARYCARVIELEGEGFSRENAELSAQDEYRLKGEVGLAGVDLKVGKKPEVPTKKPVVKEDKVEDRVIPQTRGRSATEVIEWVAENLGKEVKREEAPSVAAWEMMRVFSSDRRAKVKFYADVYLKMLVNRGEREELEREAMGDDGRLLRLVGEVERMGLEAEREG